jgi:hypothetical protein
MKASNIVISTVGVISMAGALGLVYAQSTDNVQQPGTSAATDPAAPREDAPGTMNPDPTSQDSTSATETPRSGTYNERVARADRN